MHTDSIVARAIEHPAAPALEIRVNFGIFAGREATPAEIDVLARAIIPAVGDVSIISERRYEIGASAEAELHQVRIELAAGRLPTEAAAKEQLTSRLLQAAEEWAAHCIADRHADDAEL